MQLDTIFLRFADRAAALTALQTAGVELPAEDADEQVIPPDGWASGIYFNIDVVCGNGQVWKPTGTFDGNGGEIYAQKPGFHVNMLWPGDELPPSIAAAVITPEPNDPVVVFG